MTELKIKNGIMKSVFITFDQAFYERILALLDRQNCRGFSYWQQLQGRGSVKGEPHYGSHAWPSIWFMKYQKRQVLLPVSISVKFSKNIQD